MAHRLPKLGPKNCVRSSRGPASAIVCALAAVAVLTGIGGWEEARADGPGTPANGLAPEASEFFEARVRPILVEKCVGCHGPKKQSSSLRLDSREAILKGGDSGPAAVPSRPDESLLIQAVAHRHEDLKMPPKGKLPDAAVALLTQWVAMGAPWPSEWASPGSRRRRADPAAEHWAFRPVRRAAPPPVKDRSWIASPVDAFILARLEARGIAPSAGGRPADADPPRHVRPLGHAADARGGRGVRGRPGARRLRPAGRPPAGLAPIWRALGPPLARRRPLCRHQGLRLHPGAALSLRLHLSRLRHRRLQRGPALRPVHRRADRRRPAPGRPGQTGHPAAGRAWAS